MSHESREIAIQREISWDTERRKLEALSELPQEKLKDAFEGEPGVLTCIDEGTGGDLRLAGSGILHPGGLEAVAELLQAQGAKLITAHEGCGAAEIAYRQEHGIGEHEEVDDAAVNAFAVDWSKRLAGRLNVKYHYIPSAKLYRPHHYHDAVTIYLNGTDHFRPAAVTELPQGFVINTHRSDRQNVMSEVAIAKNIALGDHGFGEKFSPDSPLTIVIVGELDDETSAGVTSLVAAADGRMVIQRLAVPTRVE